MLKRIKDKLYYYFAEKNWGVRREYGPYVDMHQEEHLKTPWKHWWLLIRLNIHYRIFRRNDYCIVNEGLGAKRGGAPKSGVPYTTGAESSKRKWPSAYQLAQQLCAAQYDVISFDVFDTLVLRKLNVPADVFSIVGKQLGCLDFYNVRKIAEREAREIKFAKEGTTEVTLDEIYSRVSYYTGLDPAYGANLEFNVERNICFANPYLHQVFQILKAMGKTVVATSDMYLTREQMKILLDGCGYEKLDAIYVSSQERCNKETGEIYNRLKQIYGEDANIFHMGDYFLNDVKRARECGLTAMHYRNCRDMGNVHRCIGQSCLIESAYRAIINNTLHNGIQTYTQAWEYGFVYGGLATLGYVNWIHERAKEHGIEKLLFLSRDGFVLKQAYDFLFDNIPSDYVYWSRAAALRCVSQGERYFFVDHLLNRRKNSGESIEDALQICGLRDFASVYSAQRIDITQEITDENLDLLRDILIANWCSVEKCLEGGRKATENYLRATTKGFEKIGLVDLGFSGKNTRLLQEMLEKIGLEKEHVSMYLLGNTLMRENADMVLSGEIQCYMFDNLTYPEIRNIVVRSGEWGCKVFEKTFGAPHTSFLGFNNKGEMEFLPAEAENNKKILEIQRGILDFCHAYYYAFSNYPEFYKITSSDAFRPFQMILNNKAYANKVLGDLVHIIQVSSKGIHPSGKIC